MIAVRRALQDKGLLQRPGLESLRVIGVDEIDMIEPLVRDEESLLDIFQKHAGDSGLRNVSLRNFLERRYTVPRNDTLHLEFREIVGHGLQILFREYPGDTGLPPEEAVRQK